MSMKHRPQKAWAAALAGSALLAMLASCTVALR
jgi:hypothetical protein